ncbi:MAG: efflux transporter outer membrane subunit [Sphingomonadales bacterium]|nr:efflux transporter outer membrane subunit [Sphingomonadales bacterium]
MVLPFPKSARTWIAPLALAAGGCAAVPASVPQPEPMVATAVAAEQSLPARSGAAWPDEGMWRAYGDPQLGALIEEAIAHAPDLAAVMARYRAAAAVAQQAAGATLPTLDVQGKATEDKQSYNNGFPKAFLPQGWNDNGQIAASLGFDLDIWGRNHAALAAARADARAAQIDAQQARLVLAAGVALAYIDLSRLMNERDIRQAMLEARRSSFDLVGKRVAQGLDARGSLRLSEAAVAGARGDLAAADEMVLLRRHQLAALLGAGPDRGLAIARPSLPAAADRGLPEGVTTDLLGRRPDVVAARERVESAGARIKVARADFFPSIKLNALIGLQSLGLGNLISGDSTFGSVGPAISLPLFHGGALQGRYRGAEATYDGAVADYNRTVVSAYQQVADAVTSRKALGERLIDARAAETASREAWTIARHRYEGGLSTYLDVLSVEDRLLQARLAANALDGAARSAEITLIRALGGGFRQANSKETEHE